MIRRLDFPESVLNGETERLSSVAGREMAVSCKTDTAEHELQPLLDVCRSIRIRPIQKRAMKKNC